MCNLHVIGEFRLLSISFPSTRMAPARMKQPVSLPCRPRCLEFGSASARWTSSVCPTPASWHKETSPGLDPETRPWGSASLAYCPPSQVLHHGDNSWPLCNPCSNAGFKKGLGEVTELFCATVVGLDTHFFASVTTQRILLHIK